MSDNNSMDHGSWMKTDSNATADNDNGSSTDALNTQQILLSGRKRSRSPSTFIGENVTTYDGIAVGQESTIATNKDLSSDTNTMQSEEELRRTLPPSSSSYMSSILGKEERVKLPTPSLSLKPLETQRLVPNGGTLEESSESSPGIFDDADDDSPLSDLKEAQEAIGPNHDTASAKPDHTNSEAGSSVSPGGIFDDADEDETFDLEVFNSTTIKTKPAAEKQKERRNLTHESSPEKPNIRPDRVHTTETKSTLGSFGTALAAAPPPPPSQPPSTTPAPAAGGGIGFSFGSSSAAPTPTINKNTGGNVLSFEGGSNGLSWSRNHSSTFGAPTQSTGRSSVNGKPPVSSAKPIPAETRESAPASISLAPPLFRGPPVGSAAPPLYSLTPLMFSSAGAASLFGAAAPPPATRGGDSKQFLSHGIPASAAVVGGMNSKASNGLGLDFGGNVIPNIPKSHPVLVAATAPKESKSRPTLVDTTESKESISHPYLAKSSLSSTSHPNKGSSLPTTQPLEVKKIAKVKEELTESNDSQNPCHPKKPLKNKKKKKVKKEISHEKQKPTLSTKPPSENESNAQEKQGKKKRERKVKKPARKVLMSKKEQEAADALLSGSTDLTNILPMKDCNFLGRELWIFTLRQLEYVLEPREATTSPSVSNPRRDPRQELLDKLISSHFVKVQLMPPDVLSTENDRAEETKGNEAPRDKSAAKGAEIVEENCLRAAAEDKISTWKKAVQRWKDSGSKVNYDFKKFFVLEGPMKFLFPLCARNFVRSANINTAYDFMCLKRTETGSAIDMYRIWRQKCGLKEINALALAKNLLGIGARIETAIGSVPHADTDTRSWMAEPIIVLTGAAKDYVISESKIYDANDFTTRQTKDLADGLALWREAKGLPILKGTGKVAMISSWKAQVKDELDIQAQCGKIIEGIDFVKEAEKLAKEEADAWAKANEAIKSEPEMVDEKKDQTKPKKGDKKKEIAAKKEDEKNNQIEPKEGCKNQKQIAAEKGGDEMKDHNQNEGGKKKKQRKPERGCKKEGDSETDEVGKKNKQSEPERGEEKNDQNESKKSTNHPPKTKSLSKADAVLQSATFLATIFENDTISILDAVGIKTAKDLRDAKKTVDSPLVKAVISMRRQSVPGDDLVPAESYVCVVNDWCQKLDKKLRDIGDSKSEKKSKKRKLESAQGESSPNKSQKAEKTQKVAKVQKRAKEQKTAVSSDPYDSMSSTTKVFLKTSLGITTAEGFLTARTTDIANAFIKYREEKEMVPLKGSGAIASVSSWKALVRKAAKNFGNDRLASLTPDAEAKSTSVRPQNAQRNSEIDAPQSSAFDIPEIMEKSDQSVLFGLPKKRFGVHRAGENKVYKFELSVRISSREKSKKALHLTYLGCCVSEEKITSEKESLPELSFGTGLRSTSVSVLQHATNFSSGLESNEPFCSIKKGCGTFEIGKLGALPVIGLVDEIKEAMQAYVSGEASNVLESYADSFSNGGGTVGACNVFEVRQSPEGNGYFPIFHKPIEAGQTMELHFYGSQSSRNEAIKSSDAKLRCWINEKIAYLPPTELRALLDHLNGSIGKAVYPMIEKAINERSTLSSTYICQLVISRRRIHWLATKINARLKKEFQRDGINFDIRSSAHSPFWTSHEVELLQRLPLWKDQACSAVQNEAREEILTEFSSYDSGNFASTRSFWCKFAKKLFHKAIALFADYAARVDDKQLVQVFCELASEEASRFMRYRLASQEFPDDTAMYSNLLLKYKEGEVEYSEFLPSTPKSAYLLRVVASQGTNHGDIDSVSSTSGDNSKVIMQPIQEFSSNKSSIHFKWYVEYQILAVINAAVFFGIGHMATERNQDEVNELLGKVRREVRTKVRDDTVDFPDLLGTGRSQEESVFRNLPPLVKEGKESSAGYKPHSLPFFLGLVWPVMKMSGWKLEVGQSPCDIQFLPPGKSKDLKNRMKEAAQKRLKLARTANGLGLGYVPKLSKRLLIVCSKPVENFKNKMSVSQSLTQYKRHYADKYSDGEKSITKVIKVMNLIGSLFEELAPKLLFKDEADRFGDKLKGKLGDSLGCEFLMRLLLVLPSILEQCDLSVQQVRDTKGVARELMDYLASHHQICFDKSLHPPPEEYVEEETQIPSFLQSRIRQGGKGGGGGGNGKISSTTQNKVPFDDLKELVLPSDRPDLTDFIEFVINQVIVCRATEEDILKKARRVRVGFPGLLCKHCLGRSGRGKFFFSSMESLTTTATVVEQHLYKCDAVPIDVKNKVIRYRSRHAEQQKNIPKGAQGAYYGRLWKRFCAAKGTGNLDVDMLVTVESSDVVGGAASSTSTTDIGDDVLNSSTAAGKKSTGGDDSYNNNNNTKVPPEVEFRDHVSLLEYIKKTTPSLNDENHNNNNNNTVLKDAITRYYECLSTGGKIYNTNAMSQHYSSEWLLAKFARSASKK